MVVIRSFCWNFALRTVSKAMVIGRSYFQLLESPNLQTVLLPPPRVNIARYRPRGWIVRGYSLRFKYVLNWFTKDNFNSTLPFLWHNCVFLKSTFRGVKKKLFSFKLEEVSTHETAPTLQIRDRDTEVQPVLGVFYVIFSVHYITFFKLCCHSRGLRETRTRKAK